MSKTCSLKDIGASHDLICFSSDNLGQNIWNRNKETVKKSSKVG